jgi:hypothetical protein
MAVTALPVAAEFIFFRPLKRAGDLLAYREPQSHDWGQTADKDRKGIPQGLKPTSFLGI